MEQEQESQKIIGKTGNHADGGREPMGRRGDLPLTDLTLKKGGNPIH